MQNPALPEQFAWLWRRKLNERCDFLVCKKFWAWVNQLCYHPYFSWLIFDEYIGGCALPFRKRQTPKARTSFCSSWRHHFGDWSLHDRNHPSLLWLALAWVHRGLRVVFSDTTETKNTCFFLLIFSWFFSEIDRWVIINRPYSLMLISAWCWFQHEHTGGARCLFGNDRDQKHVRLSVLLDVITSGIDCCLFGNDRYQKQVISPN